VAARPGCGGAARASGLTTMLPRLLPRPVRENQAELYDILALTGLVTRIVENNVAKLAHSKPRWRTDRHDQDYVAMELYNRKKLKRDP
jgi:hypothetical protein